jgi:hypothetical protein
MVFALAFAAFAIDTGQFLHTKTKLQADVDALALGGAQALCGTEECDGVAETVAASLEEPNGLTSTDDVVLEHTSNGGEDCNGFPITNHSKITARATRHTNSFLLKLFDITGADISACATAGKFAFGGSNGIRPFAMEDNCVADVSYEDSVVIKYDSTSTRVCDSSTGNYAAVAIDGTGASIYRTTIKYGSDGLVCTDTTPLCCPSMSGSCIGVYRIDTEPGNMIGPTKDGIDFLIANTPAECQTWEDVTENGDLVPACTPWNPSYTAVATRIIIIPIVDGLWDSGGRHQVTIKDFAVLFLDGYDGKCKGSDCDVRARFIKTVTTLPNAVLNPAGPLTNITLVNLVE